ncbi:MAG: HD domain-containing protein [Clostridia bacterium]|nr:HD domain-containing protein [Clostridia bacterium]
MVDQKHLDNMTREDAVAELRRLGLLIPFDDNLKLYHGRAAQEDEGEWKVDPNFNNAGDATGHININGVPALSAASLEVATTYAITRTKDKNVDVDIENEDIEQEKAKAILRGEVLKNNQYKLLKPYHPKVYRIISSNSKANFIDAEFDISIHKSSVGDKRIYYAALKKLADISPTSVMPVKYEEKSDADLIYTSLKRAQAKMKKDYLDVINTEVKALAKKLYFEKMGEEPREELFEDLVCVINTLGFLSHNPKDVLHVYRKGGKRIFLSDILDNAEDKLLNISHQAIKHYMDVNNICGERIKINRPNNILINEKDVTSYLLYLSEVNRFSTETAINSEKAENYEKYCCLDQALIAKNREKILFNDEANSVLDTRDEIDFMKKMRSFGEMDEYMKADAGVWEGYTVGEHTEAVLRLYNKYFADEMPESLQKIMRLAIFIHDLEKGKVKKADLVKEKKMARKEALLNLYSELKVSREVAEIAEFIAVDSQKFTTDYFINKNNTAIVKLINCCDDVLEKNGFEAFRDSHNLKTCCIIMQTCDSASYTSDWGVIRDEETNVYYRGGNERWNESFLEGEEKPVLKAPLANTRAQDNLRPYGT